MNNQNSSEDFESKYLMEKLRNETIPEKIKKSCKLLFMDKSELKKMRIQLILEFKIPFAAQISAESSDVFTTQLAIERFEKRIETLPDEVITDLYEDYERMKSLSNEKEKETVQNWILKNIELSYSLDGWFRKEIVKSLTRR